MTPELAEALAARLTMACEECGETMTGTLVEGACEECRNFGACMWCKEEGRRDREDRCEACAHCGHCGEPIDGDPPFCSQACESASYKAHRADEMEFDR